MDSATRLGYEVLAQGVYGVGGPATSASADGVDGIAFDAAGNLYFFGFGSKTVFVAQPSGVLTEPYGQQSIYARGDAGLATAPDGVVIAMGEQSVVRLLPTSDQTITSFYPGLFHGIRGFSPNGIAVGRDGTIYVDTFYENGFTDRSAIVSISPGGGSSQVPGEAPMGQRGSRLGLFFSTDRHCPVPPVPATERSAKVIAGHSESR